MPISRRLLIAAAGVAAIVTLTAGAVAAPAEGSAGRHAAPSYTNPLPVTLAGGHPAVNCADPFVFKGRNGDTSWYLYCTSDVLSPNEVDSAGDPIAHVLPIFRSTDLVHWKYVKDAQASAPAWVGAGQLWAPDVVYSGGRYLLYYTASATAASVGGSSAIGVLTAPSPLGPWTDSGAPAVEPQSSPYGGDGRAVFDPEVVTVGAKSYIYYGSYYGGVSVRELSRDGLTSIASTQKQIAVDNRYEGTFIVRHEGWYYFMGSATNCCGGPLTGYSVFAGRSRSPLGPFVDRDGVSLLATRVGGTPVLSQNGNEWIGAGHNAVVTDASGQDWIFYHAVDQADPYLHGQVGYTQRPLLLDPLDWKNGWPTVDGGRGPSDTAVPGPAAQPGERTTYVPHFVTDPRPGRPVSALSDNFGGTSLSAQWSWIRPPAAGDFGVGSGSLSIQTESADLQPPSTPLASVLSEPTPRGDYIVDTRVRLTLPDDGSVHNYVQGGLVIYNDDANYVKLAVSSIWDTRQTEFGKHVGPVAAGYPSYGNGVVGPVGDWTYLRIVAHEVRKSNSYEYTAYTSLNGTSWDKGGTWDQSVSADSRIGLVSMGGDGYETLFDYVHVTRVR